jgi:hypothetical protein
MCGNNANASVNITQQYLTCDIATEKLDMAAEHIKTQNGESVDVSKVTINRLIGRFVSRIGSLVSATHRTNPVS